MKLADVKQTKVSIIIVIWNSEKFLDKCYSALHDQTFQDFEVVVVDNGSTDSSVSTTRKYFKDATIIQNKENVGFAAANNQGIEASSGGYVLLLNTDCYLEPDYLEKLVKHLDGNSEVVGAQGKLLLESDHSLIDSLGIDVKVTGVAKDIMQGRLDDNRTEPFEVDALCAAAAMYRKSALDDVKQRREYFDPDFFSYYEDVDLGWRLKKIGKLVCVPDVVAYHVRGGAQLAKMHRLALRNKYFAIIKNMPTFELIIKMPAILGWEFVKFIKFLFTMPQVLGGYLDVVKDFKLFVSKRNA